MSEQERKDLPDQPPWDPPPPGFMDRPEVKKAVEDTLRRMRERKDWKPGRTVDEIFDEFEARERKRLASGD